MRLEHWDFEAPKASTLPLKKVNSNNNKKHTKQTKPIINFYHSIIFQDYFAYPPPP